jgi:hypothetical protein
MTSPSSMASLPATIVTTATASSGSSDMEDEEEMENDDEEVEEEYNEMALWDGIFWLEACRSMSRSVGWFQLLSVVEGVREEAYRAGMWFAVSSTSYPPPTPPLHWRSSGIASSGSSSNSTTNWPRSPSPPPPPLSPTYAVATTLIAQ